MTTWAQVKDGVAHNPITVSPEQAFSAEWLSAQHPFTEVPDGTLHGARLIDGEWVNPAVQDPPVSYRALTKLEFRRLCKSAGGMTDDMYVASNENPLFKAFWLDFGLAQEIRADDPDTDAGLAALAMAGYLPNGAQAVKAAWPHA